MFENEFTFKFEDGGILTLEVEEQKTESAGVGHTTPEEAIYGIIII